MFDFNRELIRYVNNARTQPKNSGKIIFNNFKDNYMGTQLHAYGKVIDTFQGFQALDDYERFMSNQISCHGLLHSKALDQAAQLIAEQKGRQGRTQNEKPKLIYQKIQNFGQVDGKIGQLVSLATSSADQVSTYFLIDDGLSSRKRRRMLLDPAYRYMGVGHAAHTQYQYITVILLAEILDEKDNYMLQNQRLANSLSQHSRSHSNLGYGMNNSRANQSNYRQSGYRQSGYRQSNYRQSGYRESGHRQSGYRQNNETERIQISNLGYGGSNVRMDRSQM